jgi:hypothetical protein
MVEKNVCWQLQELRDAKIRGVDIPAVKRTVPEETTKYQNEWDELRRRRKNGVIVTLIIFPLIAVLIFVSRNYPDMRTVINSVSPYVVVPVWLAVLIFALLGKHWKCPRCGNDYHYHYGANVWKHRRACRNCRLPLYYGSSKFYDYWGRDAGLDLAGRVKNGTL